jgi:hypothetical protein
MPFVPCSKCSTSISDVAEACPQCGHPQPIKELERGCKGGPCRFCGTFNVLYFGQGVKCRSCDRPLEEAYQEECIQHHAMIVYRNARYLEQNAGVIAAFVVMFAVFGVLNPVANPLGYVLPGLVAMGVAYLSVSTLVRWVVKQNGYETFFWSPSSYTEQIRDASWEQLEVEFLRKHPKFSERCMVPLFPLAVFALICAGLVVLVVKDLYDKSAPKAPSIDDRLIVRRSHGLFNTDLLLTNRKDGEGAKVNGADTPFRAAAYSACDLTLTVFFEDGSRLPIQRNWDRWEIGETKTVSFPNRGALQKVEIKGVVKGGDGKGESRVDLVFTWNGR